MQKSVSIPKSPALVLRVQDGMQLMKLRLSSLVVFSAMMGFLLAPGDINWLHFFILLAGGILVTGSANGFNQVIERDTDRLMDRTRNRPLADNRMPVSEALWICTIAGSVGIFMLTWLNVLSGFLGLLSILLYTLAYTPLKKKTPFAVFVGAIPGAIPPMLGWVAATGSIGITGWLLFSIQFLWQFPHFWAIAWVLNDDYKKGGFNLLPTGNRDKGSALQSLLYTLSLLPLGIMPYVLGVTGLTSAVLITIVSIYFLYKAYKLFRNCDMAAARSLMFASFIYLPAVQILLVLNRM